MQGRPIGPLIYARVGPDSNFIAHTSARPGRTSPVIWTGSWLRPGPDETI